MSEIRPPSPDMSHAIPEQAYKLLSHLAKRPGAQPIPVRKLPPQLRGDELLILCEGEGLADLVVRVDKITGMAYGPTGKADLWKNCTSTPYYETIDDVLQNARQIKNPRNGPHIRITPEGRAALARWRVGSAKSKATSKRGRKRYTNDTDAEWSEPMSKTGIAKRIFGNPDSRPRKLQAMLEKAQITRVTPNSNLWVVRLDLLPPGIPDRLESPRG